MEWFTPVVPSVFLEKAGVGLAVIGGVFLVLLVAVAVLTVRALKRNERAEDDDASE